MNTNNRARLAIVVLAALGAWAVQQPSAGLTWAQFLQPDRVLGLLGTIGTALGAAFFVNTKPTVESVKKDSE